ncbi:hypothetical protein IKF88_00940 [Candidatus Saccharibacteria bacterium]|nr:hypothetical protein [Candidatus Saccharibacteria bacterium]
MLAETELDRLKAKKQDAFIKKQTLFRECKDIKRRIDDLYSESRQIFDEKAYAYDEMKRLEKVFQEKKSQYDVALEEYEREYVKKEESLRQASEYSRKSAVGYAKMADNCHKDRNEEDARRWHDEARKHQDIYELLEQKIAELCKEKESVKRKVDSMKPKKYSDEFNRAKNAFRRAKARYESIQGELRAARRERDRKKNEFEVAQTEYSEAEVNYCFELRNSKSMKKRKATT